MSAHFPSTMPTPSSSICAFNALSCERIKVVRNDFVVEQGCDGALQAEIVTCVGFNETSAGYDRLIGGTSTEPGRTPSILITPHTTVIPNESNHG